MRRLVLLLLGLLALSGSAATLCPSELATAVNSIIGQPVWQRSYIGFHADVQTSDGWETLIDINGDKYFTPASNNKLFTTSAFLTKMGSDFEWETPVFNVNGNACIAGRGDPTITYDTVAELATNLKPFVHAGYVYVTLDDSWYNDPFPSDWEWDDLSADYGAQPSSFIANENVVSINVSPAPTVGAAPSITFVSPGDQVALTVVNNAVTGPSQSNDTLSLNWQLGSLNVFLEGSIPIASDPVGVDVAVPDPTAYWGALLTVAINQELGAKAVVSYGPCPTSAFPIYTLFSEPINVTMNWTLQQSDNLYAESYSRTLGRIVYGTNGDATSNGVAAVQAQLASLGIDTTAFIQQDGSGLSRADIVTPVVITQLLEYMYAQPEGDLYRSFLPLAGESGTLIGRFNDTPAQGVVWAKTGTLMSVSALSGYLIHSQFPPVVFSMLINLSDQGTTARQNAIDGVVVVLAELVQCSSAAPPEGK